MAPAQRARLSRTDSISDGQSVIGAKTCVSVHKSSTLATHEIRTSAHKKSAGFVLQLLDVVFWVRFTA